MRLLQGFDFEIDHTGGKAASCAAGMLPCKGAKVFLKEVKGKTFRFTIVADKRTLKLRAVDAASYQMWIDALSPT